jgi:cytochrome oxidase Cu insertion factor (SCO1/SenC/PrrC family)
MNDKQKIVVIYASVAAICVLIVLTTLLIRSNHLQPPQPEAPQYVQEDISSPLLTLEKDLVLKHQDGRDVKISDLKDKVWAFAQFYATCRGADEVLRGGSGRGRCQLVVSDGGCAVSQELHDR